MKSPTNDSLNMANTPSEALYERMLPRLELMEEQRLGVFKKLKMLKVLSGVVTILLLAVIAQMLGIFWGILLAAVLGITFYTLLYHRSIAAYRKDYKQRVMQAMVEEMGTQYSYDSGGKLSADIIRESGIFHDFNQVKCEDLVTGAFDTYSFQMADINLWYQKDRSGGSHRRRSSDGGAMSYIFKGLLFIGSLALSFPTRIWILDRAHPAVHPTRRPKEYWGKVRLKNADFQRVYDTYAEDVAIAEKLLQDRVLDSILFTRAHVVDAGMRMELSFQENRVFISISSMRELFEPPIDVPLTDYASFDADFKFLVGTSQFLQQLTLIN